MGVVDALPSPDSKKGLGRTCPCWPFGGATEETAAAEETALIAAAAAGGEREARHVGSPTECALLELAQELGFSPEETRKQQLMTYGDVREDTNRDTCSICLCLFLPLSRCLSLVISVPLTLAISLSVSESGGTASVS